MKHLIPYLIAVFLVLCGPAWAVNCTPEYITLSTQAEIDNFQTNHGPGCDTVTGGLTIEGSSIEDLSPLAELTTISVIGPFGPDSQLQISSTSLASLAGLENLVNVFWFELNNNTGLTDLTALSNLVTIRGPLFIRGNTTLTNLDGLESVTALSGGALYIEYNTLLDDLSGVSNIESINASLVVTNNGSLANLDDLSELSHVSSNISIHSNHQLNNIGGLGGLIDFSAKLDLRFNNQLATLGDLSNLTELNSLIIRSNPMLTDLGGLGSLTGLSGDGQLVLKYNNILSDIEGLSQLVSVENYVEISNNPMLDDCSPLRTLLDSIDDAEPGPGPGTAGVPDVGDEVILANNLPGCNSLPNPIEGAFTYGGFGAGRPHLLFKGSSVTLNCFGTPSLLPDVGALAVNRLQFSCSAIPFFDTDTLVYDVAADRCTTFETFQTSTNLQIDGIYLGNENTGATLQLQADAILQQDHTAVLLFDPQSGELRHNTSLLCAQPGPWVRIFKSGFE